MNITELHQFFPQRRGNGGQIFLQQASSSSIKPCICNFAPQIATNGGQTNQSNFFLKNSRFHAVIVKESGVYLDHYFFAHLTIRKSNVSFLPILLVAPGSNRGPLEIPPL